jgi:gliding-associated putative ABC transporter substrate-binding component GldG
VEEKELIMAEVKDTRSLKLKSWIQFTMIVAAIIVIASAFKALRLRLDLTEDKRYTLSTPTHNILKGLTKDVFIQVYLDGEMPIPFKKLKRSVQEMLEEFRIASGKHIDYEFINPADKKNAQEREEQYTTLYKKGLNPVDIQAGDKEGGKSQKMIFPGMLINYNKVEVPLNFLKNNQSLLPEQNILHSMESLEYEMIQTIATISSDTIYKVAFLEGQGELQDVEVGDITYYLSRFFTIDRGSINGKTGILNNYAAVIVAKPMKEFSESDKLVLDQYIMKGGKVLWLVEEVDVNSDSLINGETVGLYHPVNIEDILFRYGARINPEIIQDIADFMVLRLSVTTGAESRQIVPVPWFYYPLLSPNQNHPITKNLNKVSGEFVNTIDTVGLDPAIKKTILLSTSSYSRTLSPPLVIRLKEAELTPDEKDFNKSGLSAALLLEGVFPSAFKNRMINNIVNDPGFKLKTSSRETKMIVVADGDIIRNEVSRMGNKAIPSSLGQDKYTGQIYGNRDFIINCMNYLVDNNSLMELRSREMKLRVLDKQRIKTERLKWQLINITLPLLIVILAGIIYGFIRKRIYTKC